MFKIHAPKSHPRYLSNYYRDLLTFGLEKGLVSPQGLTAHGRGEAFDYLLGEKSNDFAINAVNAASSLFLSSKYPVISVNGNAAVLSGKEIVRLSKLINAKIEVNIFHTNKTREVNIKKYLIKLGAEEILLPDSSIIPGIDSNRRMISSLGQKKADVILVPLEDGDRTLALIKMGKKVITIDLNPLSRSAQNADITIIDNITRVFPLLISTVKKFKREQKSGLLKMANKYNNSKNINDSLIYISKNLKKYANKVHTYGTLKNEIIHQKTISQAH